MNNKKFILDACCSVKAMWYNKKHPNTVYIDIRKEPSGFLGYGRKEATEVYKELTKNEQRKS